MLFKGSGVALITPFKKNTNFVDYEKLEKLLDFHLNNNTDAIIICGTTGEGSTLEDDEFKKIISFTVKKINKRLPVIVGSGSNNTKIAIQKSQIAQSLGADGLLIVTPYYNKCTQDGLYMHYKKINDSVSIPIILYNVPSRTGMNILPETVLKLSKFKNICSIKEASVNISQISKIISIVPNDFYVYSGNDDQVVPIMSLGGKGVISVFANVCPKESHDLTEAMLQGNMKKGAELQLKYLELMNDLFMDVNPI